MKRSGLFICAVLLVPIFSLSQGGSCATPIPIPMDGVSRSYTISSSTGSNIICTSSGTSPITYFSITANSSAEDMMLRVTGPASQPVELAFYDGTSCTNGNLETASSMCFYDGTGLWAQDENFVITPNKTYVLRIKTATTGTLTLQGYYNTPPNNSCATATPIGTILTFDNNTAHKPVAGISPAGGCVVSYTNTALYTYTVDYTGPTSISLENVVCDNIYASNLSNLGFQVGIFKGSCGALTSVACYIAVQGTFQFNAGTQTAGTQMYVTINGILSSSCEYGIRAINALILATTLKDFSVKKLETRNSLHWTTLTEDANTIFEIQRSVDGKKFEKIGQVYGQIADNGERSYEFNDDASPNECFYRLKLTKTDNKNSYSKVIRVNRNSRDAAQVLFNNPVSAQLNLQVKDLKTDKMLITIIDPAGRTVYRQTANTSNLAGSAININTADFSNGLYYLILSADDFKQSFSFIKD